MKNPNPNRNRTKRTLVPVTENEKGEDVAKVENDLILPLAVIEMVIAAAVCTLTYYLRYDTKLIEDASMVKWESVTILCSNDLYYETENHNTSTFRLPEWTFYTCAIVVPSCMVILNEIVKSFLFKKKIKIVQTAKLNLKPVYRRIPRFICTFMMGGATLGLLVSVLKLMIASPRPHFMEVCNANSTRETSCKTSPYWQPHGACEGDENAVHEALRAFPSYHAALAMYCGIWTVVYLTNAVRFHRVYSANLVMVGATLVMTFIGTIYGFFTGYSSNVDIVIGALLGAVTALYVTLITLNGFKEKPFKIKILKGPASLSTYHKNMLPIKPLHGSNQELSVQFESGLSDLTDEEYDTTWDEFDRAPSTSPSFFSIPRATSNRNLPSSPAPYRPAQAVNSNLNSNFPARSTPVSAPLPPPMPSTSLGPPPSYTRTELSNSYNVPRQRYSAPVRPPQAPAYEGSRSRIINAYQNQEADTLPRARPETASYF